MSRPAATDRSPDASIDGPPDSPPMHHSPSTPVRLGGEWGDGGRQSTYSLRGSVSSVMFTGSGSLMVAPNANFSSWR